MKRNTRPPIDEMDRIERTPEIQESTVDLVSRLYLSGLTKSEISRENNIALETVDSIVYAYALAPDNSLKSKPVVIKKSIEGLRKIRINANTHVYIKPDQDEEQVRQRWLKAIERNRSF